MNEPRGGVPTRVLLVEDHASFRQAMAFIIGHEPGLTVAGQAGTLAEARSQLTDIDFALLDLHLPDGNGASLIHELHAVNPHAHALVLSGSNIRGDLARAAMAGAIGVLPKMTPLLEIIAAIHRVRSGEVLLTPNELRELSRLVEQERSQEQRTRQLMANLTRREIEVLQVLGEGLGDKEIASRLFLSTETVKTHMANVLTKLGAESRLQALIVAIRHGIVTLD